MATKLKDMTITSVDLVEQGANQEAHITLLKHKEKTVLENIKEILQKSIGSFQKTEAYNYTKVDADSAELENASITNLEQCVDDIADQLIKALEADDAQTEDVIETEVSEEVTEEVEDNTENEMEKELNKGYEKQIADLKKSNTELLKGYQDLKKQLEMKAEEEVAKKYAVIGEDTKKLTETLYKFKCTDEDLYKQFIGSLDARVALQEESNIFKEYGSNLSQMSTGADSVVKSILESSPDMTKEQALRKAVMDNPELLAEYDEEYFG